MPKYNVEVRIISYRRYSTVVEAENHAAASKAIYNAIADGAIQEGRGWEFLSEDEEVEIDNISKITN